MSEIIDTRPGYVETVVHLAGKPGMYTSEYRHAREVDVRCDCGALVTCSARDFTTTCDQCGADYNGQGSRLNPRYMWGEETGEWFGNPPPEEY